MNLTASKYVELSGNVFWDFDDDNSSDVGEGLENSSVRIVGLNHNYTATTDSSGKWSLFVPAGTSWEIEIIAVGFSFQNASI